MLKDNT